MMKLLFSTLIGAFVTDDNLRIIEHGSKDQLVKNHRDAQAANAIQQRAFRAVLKKSNLFQQYHVEARQHAIHTIRTLPPQDSLINHAINSFSELNEAANMLVKRCREWYGLYAPEAAHDLYDNELFITKICEKNRNALLKELQVEQSMGVELAQTDVDEILALAHQIKQMYHLRTMHEEYLASMMKRYCPNTNELCGTTIAAQLIEKAGSLKRLALLPSSTIQLLGAEKALFRHITRGARSPKHGFIINHPLVSKADRKGKGKAARALADKISMCARLDYFKGEYLAPQLLKELEEKLA